ncbi:MAG: class I SAM-dependent methyltransferase, partial [Oscillospiraceae bacterium]|nr:class I SAM-dependent methyltransferase [Oscillospiraceae bacterium]
SGATETIYSGKIRSGAPGRLTGGAVPVYRCENCRVIWHSPVAESDALYESDDYRASMGEAVTLPEFYRRHDGEILDKLNYTGTAVYRDKLFMDVGCGGGGYADYIRGAARGVILVEPNENFAAQLRGKGYEVFAYPGDALAKYANKVELITSYDVIEHVDDPQEFLRQVYGLLAPGGVAYIGTPTDYPVLRALLGAEFDAFVFSAQHPWVFSRKSLELMAAECRGGHCVRFYQRFGIGNLIAWLQTRLPKGEAEYGFVTPALNNLYKSEMAREETAEYLVLELRKE